MIDRHLGGWGPPEGGAPAAGEVHVWRIQLGRRPREEAWAVLSPEERARASRFHRASDRDDFIRAHSALRRILGDATGIVPERLRFETQEFGKPAMIAEGERSVAFNLSHSGRWALVAVGRSEVGVDVEEWDSEIEVATLATQYFSPAEAAALAQLRGGGTEAQVAGFFAAWTRKEAYIKATGRGISHGLDHFDVALHPAGPAALLADRTDPGAVRSWSMYSLEMGSGYSAALVVRAGVESVRLVEGR